MLKLVQPGQAPKKRFTKVSPNLYLNSETGIYYVRKTFRRFKIPDLFESTHCDKIGKAKAKADELIKTHLDHYMSGSAGIASKRNGKQVRLVIEEILETVTPSKRIGTQANHKIYLGELKKEWGQWDINRITLPAWVTWLNQFKTRKARKTFGDYVKHMNLLLRYAYKMRYITHLITLPNPDPIRNAGRVFTRAEIRALWDAMNEETRDQFVLCYECFMRLREALYLTWDRVDLDSGVVTLRPIDVKTGSKTGKGRSFNLSETALKRLRVRRSQIKGPFIFPSPAGTKPVHQNKTAWRIAKRKANVKGRARWHDLRHSALTHALLDTGADPVQVSEFAGVSLRTIQRVYLHSTHEKTKSVSKAVKIF